MKLTLEINTNEAASLEQAKQLIETLAGTPTEQPAKAKAKKAAPAKQPEEDVRPEPAITAEDIRAKVSELIKAGKRAEAKALLSEFGADTVAKLKQADYAEFMAKAEEV